MPLRTPNEDLFEHTRMTFGEHLEELRKALFRALVGAAVGAFFGFMFADEVVLWLEGPLNKAINNFTVNQAEEQLKSRAHGVVPLEYRNLLQQRIMAPKRILVDPQQLSEALRNPSPAGQRPPLPPTRFNASSISPDQAQSIARKLVQAGTETVASDADPVAAVYRAIAPEDQALLRQWAEAPAADATLPTSLVEMLHRLANQASLHTEPVFAERIRSKKADAQFSASEAKALEELNAAIESGSGEQAAEFNRQLNQWLIWSALAPDLPRPDVAFAEIDIWESVAVSAQSLSATEAFMIWMKAGIIFGLVLASPWIFYQLWTFVAAGLYPAEQRYVYVYLPISLGLFFAGASLAFFFVFDPVLTFLFQFNARLGINPQPRIGDWLPFALMLPIGFGIAFQLPLVMLFLNLVGIFTVANYVEKWRVAVLVIFIISMILTPAEPISMILMAIPLTGLYFLGIFMCRWLRPNRNPYRQAYDP
jgi:sec-independent protein translocase protein TatC